MHFRDMTGRLTGRLFSGTGRRTFLFVAICVFITGSAWADSHKMAPKAAQAEMVNADNQKIGTVALRATPNGILVRGHLRPVPAGRHAFHFHQTGRCDAGGGFKSAGGHIADGRQHGFEMAGGPHPGDMPNQYAGADNVLQVEIFNPRVSLGDGQGSNLLDADGSAIVIHAGADDYSSQPSGAAGDRIACGVIKSIGN